MMSMKLPSNEEIKKWNVDQVQEFLAQVGIENHLFTKHVCQSNSKTNLNNFLKCMTTPTDMSHSHAGLWRGLKYPVWHDKKKQ